MSKCYECKYEHSDCKGDKRIEKTECQYFSKKLAINYPKVIEELERKVEFFESLYQGQLDANEKLLLRKETLEAELAELKQMYKELNDLYDGVKAENNRLHQWTLNDKKIKYGFDLAIETLNKCKGE